MLSYLFTLPALLVGGLSTPIVEISSDGSGSIVATYTASYTFDDVAESPAESEFAYFSVLLPEELERPEVPLFETEEESVAFFDAMPVEERDALLAEFEAIRAAEQEMFDARLSEVSADLNAAGIDFKIPVVLEDGTVEDQDATSLVDTSFKVAAEDADKVNNNVENVIMFVQQPSVPVDTPICALAIDEFSALVPEFDTSRDEVVFNDFEEGVCSLTITIAGAADDLSDLEGDIETLTGAQLVVESLETGAVTATIDQPATSEIVFSFVTASGTKMEMVAGQTVTLVDPIDDEVVEEVVEAVTEVEEAEEAETAATTDTTSGSPAVLVIAILLTVGLTGAGFFLYQKRKLDIAPADGSEENFPEVS